MATIIKYTLPDNSTEVFSRLELVKGVPASTSQNFLTIFREDNHFADVRLDVMRWQACRVDGDMNRRLWDDTDDAEARVFIEDRYKLRSHSKQEDAFRLMLSERPFHPVQERVKSFSWDGGKHCEAFFIRWLSADDTAYTREASRLFFQQAVARAFRPGCKADYVIVLKGPQGGGKSTLCQWLALEDSLYSSVRTIDGQRGYEAVQGKFVCELEELLATINYGSKSDEAVKSFISGANDHYRRPFDRRTSDNPRTCVFIGSTNQDRFLTDTTGNRRWFPIECRREDGRFIYSHEADIRRDIEQAFAEMYFAYVNKLPFASPVQDEALSNEFVRQQAASEIEDPRIGLIAEYLIKQRNAGQEYTCCIDIWENALHLNSAQRPITRKDANEISSLLRHKLGCNQGCKQRVKKYGVQHAFLIPSSYLLGQTRMDFE